MNINLPPPDTLDHDAGIEGGDQIPIPTRTLKDLINPPRDLALMRQRLFEVKDKIELQVDEFERYWPYIDNVWVRQHKAGTDKSGRVITDYYACRLQRPTYTPAGHTQA